MFRKLKPKGTFTTEEQKTLLTILASFKLLSKKYKIIFPKPIMNTLILPYLTDMVYLFCPAVDTIDSLASMEKLKDCVLTKTQSRDLEFYLNLSDALNSLEQSPRRTDSLSLVLECDLPSNNFTKNLKHALEIKTKIQTRGMILCNKPVDLYDLDVLESIHALNIKRIFIVDKNKQLYPHESIATKIHLYQSEQQKVNQLIKDIQSLIYSFEKQLSSSKKHKTLLNDISSKKKETVQNAILFLKNCGLYLCKKIGRPTLIQMKNDNSNFLEVTELSMELLKVDLSAINIDENIANTFMIHNSDQDEENLDRMRKHKK